MTEETLEELWTLVMEKGGRFLRLEEISETGEIRMIYTNGQVCLTNATEEQKALIRGLVRGMTDNWDAYS